MAQRLAYITHMRVSVVQYECVIFKHVFHNRKEVAVYCFHSPHMRRAKQKSPHARILGRCQKVEIRSDKNKVESLTPFEHFVGLGVRRLLSSENHVFLYSRLETWSASVLKLIRGCLFSCFVVWMSGVPPRDFLAIRLCWVALQTAGDVIKTDNKQYSPFSTKCDTPRYHADLANSAAIAAIRTH